MANLKKVVVVLLVITLVLSAVSVVFNLMIYNMKSPDYGNPIRSSSNAGNLGFIVEGNSQEVIVGNGG
ncbi:MAG: hypothetical protein ACP5N7_02075 [Candidatus Pacearchaeota archaeon]